MNRPHRASIKRTAVMGRSAAGITALRGKLPGHRGRSAVAKVASSPVPAALGYQGQQTPEDDSAVSWIFLDASLSDVEAWLEPLQGEVVHLDPSRQGLEQVAGWLHGQINVQSVHILTHGAAGVMTLGSSTLDAQSLADQHAEALAVIAGVLSPKARFHLHGADLNADKEGRALIQALACITGAHVVVSESLRSAASDLPARDVAVSTPQSTSVRGAVAGSGEERVHRDYCIGLMPLHGMLLVQADGAWVYTPDEAFHGQDRFSVVVLEGGSIQDTVNVQVEVLCKALTSAEPSLFIDIDVGALAAPGPKRLVTAIDGRAVKPDQVVSVNRGKVVAGADGALAFLPAPDFSGATTFACTVADGLGGSAEVQVQVETLDDLAEPFIYPSTLAVPCVREGALMRAALLSVFESASAGQSAHFLAPMTDSEGLRLAQPALPTRDPDVTL